MVGTGGGERERVEGEREWKAGERREGGRGGESGGNVCLQEEDLDPTPAQVDQWTETDNTDGRRRQIHRL